MDSTEAGFLDATPVIEGAMSDILWGGGSLERAISGADLFWLKHKNTPRIAKALAGVIHSYFLAQTPDLLEFEQFIYLYTAFEGCHFVHETLAGNIPWQTRHSDRIQKLCESFNMNTPAWANKNAHQHVAKIRNDAIHEGLFFDEPLGFKGFDGQILDNNIRTMMLALVSRLLVALLELPAPGYIESPITLRSKEAVTL